MAAKGLPTLLVLALLCLAGLCEARRGADDNPGTSTSPGNSPPGSDDHGHHVRGPAKVCSGGKRWSKYKVNRFDETASAVANGAAQAVLPKLKDILASQVSSACSFEDDSSDIFDFKKVCRSKDSPGGVFNIEMLAKAEFECIFNGKRRDVDVRFTALVRVTPGAAAAYDVLDINVFKRDKDKNDDGSDDVNNNIDDKGGNRPGGVSDDSPNHNANDDKGGNRPAGTTDDSPNHNANDDKGGRGKGGRGGRGSDDGPNHS